MNSPASPFVSPDHWSYQVIKRLDRAGLLPPGVDVARQNIPQEEIAALLSVADSLASTNFLLRFRNEFKAPRVQQWTLAQRSVALGRLWTKDLVAPGIGYDSIAWSGARRLADIRDEAGGLALSFMRAPHLATALNLDAEGVNELQLVLTAGYFGVWGGRRPIGYGLGHGGGLVLNAHTLDGAGVFLPRPLRLPLMGAVRFEMHASKIHNVLNFNNVQREIEPWFWTARGSLEPFANLRIGINRGMMFGGEGNLPVTFERVAKNIIGIYTDNQESNFANQIISVDFQYKLPGVPLVAYLDWASDDGAGAWWDVPGTLAGLEWVSMQPDYDLAFGIEHTQFSGFCCSNSIWYRNAWFRGSWADGDDMLGHPLGGHGREWRVFAGGGFGMRRFLFDVALYQRRRRDENILAPAWQGKSFGLEGAVDFAFTPFHRLRVAGESERGDADWAAGRLSATLHASF